MYGTLEVKGLSSHGAYLIYSHRKGLIERRRPILNLKINENLNGFYFRPLTKRDKNGVSPNNTFNI